MAGFFACFLFCPSYIARMYSVLSRPDCGVVMLGRFYLFFFSSWLPAGLTRAGCGFGACMYTRVSIAYTMRRPLPAYLPAGLTTAKPGFGVCICARGYCIHDAVFFSRMIASGVGRQIRRDGHAASFGDLWSRRSGVYICMRGVLHCH